MSALEAADFPAIAAERAALAEFRQEMEVLARDRLPEILHDREKLHQALEDLTNDALKSWKNAQRRSGDVAKRVFGDRPLEDIGKFAQKVAEGALKEVPASAAGAATSAGVALAGGMTVAGLSGPLLAGAAVGFGISVVFKTVDATISSYQDRKTAPLRYLSLLRKRGVTISLSAPPKAQPEPHDKPTRTEPATYG